jgi:cytochrome P450
MKSTLKMGRDLIAFSPRLARLAASVLGSPLRYLKGDLALKNQIIINLPDAKLALVNELVTVGVVMSDKQGTYPKSKDLELLLRPLIGRGLFAQPGGEAVKQVRKTYVKALSQLTDEDVAAVSTRMTKRYLEAWRRHQRPVRVPSELSRLAIDIVTEATLGRCFTAEESQRFAALFFQYHKKANPLLGLLTPRSSDDRVHLLARLGLEKVGAEMRDLIRHRFLTPLLQEDPVACAAPLARVLLESTQILNDGAKPLADDLPRQTAILDEIAVMLLAGHETSASVLSWLLWELADMPDEQREIRRLLHTSELQPQSSDAVTAQELGSSADRRLAALISESLRLHPPIALLLRETTQDIAVGERHLPADSFVVVSPWTIQRHPDRWEDAQTFMPSRWLSDLPPSALQDRMAFIPFGQGPRVCPGKRFAEVELQAILSELMRSCDFSRPWGRSPKPLGTLTSRPDRDFRLVVKQQRA